MEFINAVHDEKFSYKDGIYFPRTVQKELSYPEDGNDICFAIEESSFWFNHRNNVIKAGLELYPPGGAIFDVGGGNGFVARYLEDNGYPCVLFEPGPQGAKNAKQRGLENVFCAMFNEETIRPNSVPAVGLFDVLEHIEDDVGFLKMIRSRLQEGGRLYITVPAYMWLWSIEDEAAGHFRRYTRKVLKEKLEEAGFHIAYSTYFFWFLPLPIFLVRRALKIHKNGKTGKELQETSDNARKTHSIPKLFTNTSKFMMKTEVKAIKKQKKIIGGGSLLMCMINTSQDER